MSFTTNDDTGQALAYIVTPHAFKVTPMSEARKRIEQAGIDFANRKTNEPEIGNPEPKKSLKEKVIRDWLDIGTPDPIDPEIDGYNPEVPKPPTIRQIKKEVSERRGVSIIDMESPRRAHKIVYARFEAMWISRHLTTKSYPEIGREFGNRDHTSVLHAVGRYTRMLQVGEAAYPPNWDHSITIEFKPLEYTENRRKDLQAVYDAFTDAYEKAHGHSVYIRSLGNQWVAVEREGALLFKAKKPKLIELTEQYRTMV